MKHKRSMNIKTIIYVTIISLLCFGCSNTNNNVTKIENKMNKQTSKIINIDNLSIFYREAGNKDKETILLLHGFPSSSYMYSELINELSNNYHLIAPDYPGFGLSSAPTTSEFQYTFDNVAEITNKFIDELKLKNFYLLMQDFGGPIGFRIANKRPELIKGLIIQNANAYMEGLGEWPVKMKKMQQAGNFEGLQNFQDYLTSLEGIKEQHIGGAKNPTAIDPSFYLMDHAFLSRNGALEIQKAMLADYGNNFPKYSEWQNYMKTKQPKTLVVWGENDKFFSKAGGEAYNKDLKNIETHFFEGNHFMLDEYSQEVAELITNFIN